MWKPLSVLAILANAFFISSFEALECEINEVLVRCPAFVCRPQQCTEVGFPVACPARRCSKKCPVKSGCVCEAEYARNENGVCIPIKECPTCGGDPNAVSGCGVNCGRRCSDYTNTDIPCIEPCYPNACDCREGFLLDDNTKKCVLPIDCSPTCGNNEVYDGCANGGCRKWVCSQPILCIDPLQCEGGCICQTGYTRDQNGDCILEEQCPELECADDERYEECPDNLCTPQTCSQLGFPINCPALSGNSSAECPGEPGCICDNDNVRDDEGTCIPKHRCPSCGGDPNAVTGCGINCGRHCYNYKEKNVVCALICRLNSCDCRKGFVYDDNVKKCVRPKDCTPTCGTNEVYNECANSGCRRWSCSDTILCIDPDRCEGGCICQDGYTRDDNGECIPEIECPDGCDRPHEYFDDCAQPCPPQTCENIGVILPCPFQPCEGSCRCESGYYRNKIGECISKDDCRQCTGPNEYFSCGGACDNVCATINQQNQTNCPIINIQCNRMCYCENDYARDANGICIPIDQCPAPPCGNNEVYDGCANGGCRKWVCSQPILCIDPLQCEDGCICQTGYTRDQNGDCILEEQCPELECADDERYEECPDNLCTPQTCSQLGFPINCPALSGNSSAECPGEPGCICDNDNVRDDEGTCIPKHRCPSCGGDPNAVTGCGINCGRHCFNYKEKNVVCALICRLNSCDCRKGFVYDDNVKKCVRPKDCTPTCGTNEVYNECANSGCRRWSCSDTILCIDPDRCEGGCICQDGHTRDDNGECIPEIECPDGCDRPHKYFDDCAQPCPPQICENIGVILPCPFQPCEGSCRCESGYYRNKIGECISEDDCRQCTGPNEYFSCGGACDNVCATIKQQNQTNCPIINIQCNRMCYCENDYARDANGICIPIDQCPELCTGPHEYYDDCPQYCPPQTCDSIGITYDCPIQPAVCSGIACRCESGYYRNKINECISEDECQMCTGPNEYFSCGGACDNVCATIKQQNQTNCPIINIQCNRMCYCEKDYARDANGICIPIDQCPEPCTGPHEYYDDCPQYCPPQTCDSIGMIYNCPIQPAVCRGVACRCESGYYRNKINECISEDECKMCTGPNEYFSCGGACDNVCATLNKQNQTNCPIINIDCNRMCYCEKDYARNDQGICIPIDQCPAPLCADDERYEECPDSLCTPLTCSQLGFPLDCPEPGAECPGEPGCVCDFGNVRDEDGNCIPRDQCPSCGGDPNAVSGCGINCRRRCATYRERNALCPDICNLNGCDCKRRFVFDDNLNKCVRRRRCTPTCGINEVYDECANGGCRKLNCSRPVVCIDPIECEGGCVCQNGYTRNRRGICIPEDQCPDICNKPHEIYNYCAPTCSSQTCESIGTTPNCSLIQPAVCRIACVCEEGYYRNKIGECISAEECKRCTGPNEYFSCGGACDNVCATLNKQNQTNCPIINVRCNPMCYCEQDYARDASGICIPIDQCPAPQCADDEIFEACPNSLCTPVACSQLGFPIDCPGISGRPNCYGEPTCLCDFDNVRDDNGRCIPKENCPSCGGDPNAVSGCGDHCGRTCSDYNNTAVICPQRCMPNGCNCKQGFVYDGNTKKCVRPSDCTPTCGANEVFDICANGGCRKWNCREPYSCIYPFICVEGCICQEGYTRANNGTCIPEKECPGECNMRNEYYQECAQTCPPETCDSVGRQYKCAVQVCQGGACRCRRGYYRNHIGQCITENECKQCTGPNEFFSCGGACDNVCATLYRQNRTNCPIINIQCNRRCYCEDGYARDENGICIPIDQCPVPKCGCNEVFEKQPSRLCGPKCCSELGFPLPCPRTDCNDIPRCICKPGYVRNRRGRCIPMSECPSCGGDPNAVVGCGAKCGKTCEDFGTDIGCIEICYLNACDCREGFVYDEAIKKCVRYEDCTKTCLSSVNKTDVELRLDRATIALSGEFIYQLSQSNPDENFVTSASSLLSALAPLTIYSEGLVLQQLLALFNLQNKEEIKCIYPDIIANYKNQTDIVFEYATKYYANVNYPLTSNFVSDAQKYFDASGENVDFSENVEAAEIINDWVETRTHDRIQDLISADMLNANTVLVLVNAIYFLGNWVHQFNPNNTEERDFTKRNQEVIQIDMMYQENDFRYAEDGNLRIQALEMLYKNSNYSFLVVLPEIDSFDDTIEALRDSDVLIGIIDSLSYQKVQVYLPKMEINTNMDMAEMLKKADVTAMFDPAYDGFQGILQNSAPLYVSDIVQKAFLLSDETGTEAAAATAWHQTSVDKPNPRNSYSNHKYQISDCESES